MQGQLLSQLFSLTFDYSWFYKVLAVIISLAVHLFLGLLVLGNFHKSNEFISPHAGSREVMQVHLERSVENSVPNEKKIQFSGNLVSTLNAGPKNYPPIAEQWAMVTPSPELFSLTEPYYYHTKDLTIKPRIIEDATTSLTLAIPGVTLKPAYLVLLINEYGEVDKVIAEESSYPDNVERLIVETFTKLKFHPGEISDQPVKSQIKIEVTFNGVVPTFLPKQVILP